MSCGARNKEAVMAHSLLALALLLGADAGVQRPFHEINAQITDLFKREAQPADRSSRAAAIYELCELHGQIVSDARYATSDKLKEYRARIWSRLKKVESELKAQLAHSPEAADKHALANAAALAAADAVSVAAADSLATSLALLDQAQGGPGVLLAFGGGAVPGDDGPRLVELIQRTINPAFWDVQGGPGTIVYYAPLQCLVVRATSEVHGNVGGLIGDLRAAGR
jgi:hypothetical protein